MKGPRLFYTLTLLWLTACAALGTQSEFLAGRRALLRGETENALSYFDPIARSDPGFASNSVLPRKNIWTYVGRAHYNAGRYDIARSAFEKALSQRSDDHVARLYYGLTLLRPSPAPAPTNAFSLQELAFALREGVEPKRVATLARGRGVAFDLNKETESQLRTAGADTFLVNELKSLRSESAKRAKSSESSKAQGGKELATALSGLLAWLNDIVANSPQGRFWDPSREILKQIQLTQKQVTASPPDWDTVISNAEWLGYTLEEESDRAHRDEVTERNRRQSR